MFKRRNSNKRYMGAMEERGLIFPSGENGGVPCWPEACASLQRDPLRLTGCVGEELSAYLSRHDSWCEAAGQANAVLCDETVFEALPFVVPPQWEGHKMILWIRQLHDKYPPQNFPYERFDAIYVSGQENGAAVQAVAGEAEVRCLPVWNDFTQYSPVNHGMQSMRASVGVILPRNFTALLEDGVIVEFLQHWAVREDLLVWRHKESSAAVLQSLPWLLQRMGGVYVDAEDVDPDASVQLILDFSGQKQSCQQFVKRGARGQLWASVVPTAEGWMAQLTSQPAARPLVGWMQTILEEHNFLLKERTILIRQIWNDSSTAEQLNQIVHKLFGRALCEQGVSVLVSSNRPESFDHILANYRRQKVQKKELILLFHCAPALGEAALKKMRSQVEPHENIQIYSVDASELSFGYTLNYGLSHTRFEYVAKFDDDDHYGPHFLSDMLPAFEYAETEVCGHLSFHTFFEGSNELVCRKPGNEYIPVSFLPGATLLIRREVLTQVMFEDVPRDIDGRFCFACQEKGVKMFASDSFNLLVTRLGDKSHHTWKAADSLIRAQSLPAYQQIDARLEKKTAYYLPEPTTSYQAAVAAITV